MMRRAGLLLGLVALAAGAPPSKPQWPLQYTSNATWTGFWNGDNPIPAKFQVDTKMGPNGLEGRERVDFWNGPKGTPDRHVAFIYDYVKGVQWQIDYNTSSCTAFRLPPPYHPTIPLPFGNATFVKERNNNWVWYIELSSRYPRQFKLQYTEKVRSSPGTSVPVSMELAAQNVLFSDFQTGAPDPSAFVPPSNCPATYEDQTITSHCVGWSFDKCFTLSGRRDTSLDEVTYPRVTSGQKVNSDWWGGGDGGQTVQLPGDRIAFNFDDNGCGWRLLNQRLDSHLVGNLVGILSNASDPKPENLQLYASRDFNAFYQPYQLGSGRFWAGVGPVFEEKDGSSSMYFIGTRLYKDPVTGKGQSNNTLFIVSNVQESPDDWTYNYTYVPESLGDHNWGGGVYVDESEGYVYIIGGSKGFFHHPLHLSRVAIPNFRAGELEGVTEYYTTEEEWTAVWPGVKGMATLTQGYSDCTSLNYNERMKLFYVVLIDDPHPGYLYVATSKKITGPYKKHRVGINEKGLAKGFWQYCAVAHPSLARSEDEIVVSYYTNGADNDVLSHQDPNSYISRYWRINITELDSLKCSACVLDD